jgi:predicted O-methyltransferase YrrM
MLWPINVEPAAPAPPPAFDLDQVPGWFDYADVYDAAVERSADGDTFVEVGSYFGKSAIYLAQAIKRSGKAINLFCVDPWRDTMIIDKQLGAGADLLPDFLRNIADAGVSGVIKVLRMPSLEAANRFAPESLAFVFLDGDHSLEAVRADIRAWLPKIKLDGCLAGHDYDRPGTVKHAVRERFGNLVESDPPRSWSYVKAAIPRRTIGNLCVAINVRNEAGVIARCIEGAARFVGGVVVCDTGCTDNTLREVFEICAALDLPLKVTSRPWLGFASNQTQILADARAAGYEYAWILDADEHCVGGDLPPVLDAAAYSVTRLLAGDWEVTSPRIFRLDAGWAYYGERHATPRGNGACVPCNLVVDNLRDGGNGTASAADQAARFRRDVVTFLGQVMHDRTNTRAWYYLAQSARDAGQREIADWAFRARVDLPDGYNDERYLSALWLARAAADTRDRVTWYQMAVAIDPMRLEARTELAREYRLAGLLRDAKRHLDFAARVPASANAGGFLVQRSFAQWRVTAELCATRLAMGDATALLELCALYDKHPTGELWGMVEDARTQAVAKVAH